ncbi:recombinase family protein [Scardovia inopinata]|nr:recombinase family protein [Scardovia inopinata]
MFSAFAQFKRDMIVTRTQEGKAYAKRNDPHFRACLVSLQTS